MAPQIVEGGQRVLEGSYSLRLVSLTLAAGIVYSIYNVLRKDTSKLPGPWYSKWTRIVLSYHWIRGERAIYVDNLHKRYGPIVRIAPNEVDVTDLDDVKTIYSIKETFVKDVFYKHLVPSPIPGLFSTRDVEHHRKMRRLFSSQMSESQLKSHIPLVDSRVRLAIQRAKEEMEMRGAADMFKWSLFMATDVIGELSFGESFRMLENGAKNQYVRDLESIASMATIRTEFPSLVALARKIPLPVFRQVAQLGKNIAQYARQSLHRYSEMVMNDPVGAKQTLFTRLVKAEEDERITFGELLVNAQGYIVAGSDTTANSLTYLLWSVSRRSDIRDRLVEELQTLKDGFEETDLRELPYLHQVIEETLRLYPAVPTGLPRVVPHGGAEFGDYWLNEGTVVCAQAYTMHRNPDIFPNPNDFDPSRWASPTKAMKDSMMPFGRGPRICIGLHLAYIELRLATARFFLEFPTARMSSREGMSEKDMVQKLYFLMHPQAKRCLIEK